MSLDVSLTCAHCGTELFEANITHNLNTMAVEGGFYEPVWEPEEIGIFEAHQLTPKLEEAVAKLRAQPEHYKLFDSPNGWGLYENFLPWLERYLEACKAHPDAKVTVSR